MTRRTSNNLTVAAFLCVAGTLQLLRTPASAQGSDTPDLVFSNGKIVTVDERFTIAQAVAVKGDRIVAVGSTRKSPGWRDPNTRRIDLRGRTVIPGLIDNHLHLLRAATPGSWSCGGMGSTRGSRRSK